MFNESDESEGNFIKQHNSQQRYYLSLTHNGSLQESKSFISFKIVLATPICH